MKKIFTVLLALTLVFTLAACGNDKEPAKDNTDPANSQGSENQASNSGDEAKPSVEKKDGFTALTPDKALRKSDIEITGLKTGKEKFKSEEAITFTLSWTGTPLEDTWIGIIPADIPHGDEEKNDEFDVDYKYLPALESGKEFSFEGLNLEPGKYTLRVNESDSGGAELAWCEFTVK